MKKIKFIPLIIISFLAGCDIKFVISTNKSVSDSEQTSVASFMTSTDPISNSFNTEPVSISNSVPTSSSFNTESASISNDVTTTESTSISESVSTSNSPIVIDKTRTLSIYGINDFHGAVLPNEDNGEPGIVKLGAYLIDKKSEGNTLLINSGDMWQGAIESNYNYGNLLTDCMNMIQFDCFTIGNHEFDWGASFIQANRNRDYEGYQTPFLAANIYNYEISTKKTKEYANLGDKYTIQTLDNGLRVGIIGIIGESQITSICSQFADEFTFINPENVVKSLSDELRTKQNVDVVVLDCHTDQGTIGTNVTNISSVSNKRYVDAVFCAHTHQNETQIVNGVPYIQTDGYGKMISNVELAVEPNGSVSCSKYENISSYSETSTSYNSELDELVQRYKAESDEVGNEVLGTLSGELYSSNSLPNFVTEAMASAATAQGFNISYAITNYGRANLSSGRITYANLYRSLPFDNETYIIKVSGATLKKELEMSSISFYRLDKNALDETKSYVVAVIDYLAFHRNVYRNYNYFPDLEIIGKLTKEGKPIYNYRDVTADFLRSKTGSINYRNYLDSVDSHNPKQLSNNI